jgi:hypothetical protein
MSEPAGTNPRDPHDPYRYRVLSYRFSPWGWEVGEHEPGSYAIFVAREPPEHFDPAPDEVRLFAADLTLPQEHGLFELADRDPELAFDRGIEIELTGDERGAVVQPVEDAQYPAPRSDGHHAASDLQGGQQYVTSTYKSKADGTPAMPGEPGSWTTVVDALFRGEVIGSRVVADFMHDEVMPRVHAYTERNAADLFATGAELEGPRLSDPVPPSRTDASPTAPDEPGDTVDIEMVTGRVRIGGLDDGIDWNALDTLIGVSDDEPGDPPPPDPGEDDDPPLPGPREPGSL